MVLHRISRVTLALAGSLSSAHCHEPELFAASSDSPVLVDDEDILLDGEPPPAGAAPNLRGASAADLLRTSGSTLLAVLPDTQYYAYHYPDIFAAQTAWIAANAETLDIAYVFHLGDIVHTNTEVEWDRARAAMRQLDGAVPWALVPGNHDYGPGGDASTRDSLLNDWFLFEDAAQQPGFGGAYAAGQLDNTYHLFEAGGHAFIAMMLEWGPRDEVIAWADEVMTRHPDRLGILVTHAYLDDQDRRLDHRDDQQSQAPNPHRYGTAGGVNDGEELWQKLVRRHRFVMTLNGHVLGDGAGYLASVNDHGDVVHQMLSNYQMRPLGGEGYLRLLELLPDGRTVRVHSYSPLRDEFLLDPEQHFSFELAVDA